MGRGHTLPCKYYKIDAWMQEPSSIAQFTVNWRTGFVGIQILFCIGLVQKYHKSTPNARKECVCWAVTVALQWPLVIVFQRLMPIMGAGEESRHGEVAQLLFHRDSLCLFDPVCKMKMHLFHLCEAALFPYSSKLSLFVGQQFIGVDSQYLETTTLNSSTGRGDCFLPSGVYPDAQVKSLLGSVLNTVLLHLPRAKEALFLIRTMLSFMFDTDLHGHNGSAFLSLWLLLTPYLGLIWPPSLSGWVTHTL